MDPQDGAGSDTTTAPDDGPSETDAGPSIPEPKPVTQDPKDASSIPPTRGSAHRPTSTLSPSMFRNEPGPFPISHSETMAERWAGLLPPMHSEARSHEIPALSPHIAAGNSVQPSGGGLSSENGNVGMAYGMPETMAPTFGFPSYPMVPYDMWRHNEAMMQVVSHLVSHHVSRLFSSHWSEPLFYPFCR